MNDSEKPDHVFLDSSLLAAGSFLGSANTSAAVEFFDRLTASDSVIYISQLVRFEYAQTLQNLAIYRNRLPVDVRSQFDLDRWHDDLVVRTRWFAHGEAEFRALISQFAVVYDLPFRQQFWDRVLRLMAYYNLRSYDAVHLATIQHYGIPHLATCDRHFASIDGLSLFLVRDS